MSLDPYRLPELSKWLDEDEKRFLKLRKHAQERTSVVHVRDEQGEIVVPKQTKITWPVIRSVLCDWKIYLQAFIAMSNTIPAYALKFTMPQIIKNIGFTSSNAQLLTIPPYAVGAVSAYVSARFADRYKWRMPSSLFFSFASSRLSRSLRICCSNRETHPADLFRCRSRLLGSLPYHPRRKCMELEQLSRAYEARCRYRVHDGHG